MGTLIGFAIGYWLGLKDGKEDSVAKMLAAWQKISKSAEFRALLSGGSAILMQTLQQNVKQLFASSNGRDQSNILGQVLKQGVILLVNQPDKRR